MSLPITSDILQHDTNMFKEQCCKIQRRHEEEQQLQAQLEEAAEAFHVECAAQKVRKVVEAKARKKAKKKRLVEEKKKKKQMEYLQQLWDKVLAENTTLLEDTGGSQVTGTKCKKVNSEDNKE